MDDSQLKFQARLRPLMRKHDAMSRGYVTRMRPDGLIVVKPRRAQSRISGRSILLFLGAFLVFKGFLLASLGAETYNDRIARLKDGSFVEKAGGFVMQADPVSQAIAQKLWPLLR